MKKSIATMLLCIAALTASAQTNFEIRYAAHPADAKHYDTERLRKDFLIEKV